MPLGADWVLLHLVFVAVTIPAGIYAQVHYGQSLANVDWLHGSAEFFLTLSNILIVRLQTSGYSKEKLDGCYPSD